ncbi:hypothetical protein OA92_14150 [Marinomonas sp. SBI22]|jgi:hypothetical protein|nr:hypothetical protein TW85_09295 [Marinomonas sp. S3726]KZM41537.1 hypothetical protein OA92_14150 [Marinomonas sp. SBI22]KZM43373.1 hypothetical protein OA91_12355 [Marinomonas sp. SBI8L]
MVLSHQITNPKLEYDEPQYECSANSKKNKGFWQEKSHHQKSDIDISHKKNAWITRRLEVSQD